ncbi:hypothetical protein IDH12_00150 [Pelagibacterales bacterium SAG-MED29]|nr:hypothetical protein [Pelagibacterales bacterium SAG-MED29]
MRVLIAVLVLIFSLQSWTKADDISDFEIEGMSIGDSLLDFYSEREINNFYNYDHLPSDMKFRIADDQRTTGSYDSLQFFYKPKDQKFKIYSISGAVFCNSKNECNKIFEEIKSDMAKSLGGKNFKKNSYRHSDDKSGKSFATYYYLAVDGGHIKIEYMDWSEKVEFSDNVNVAINSIESIKWMQSNYGTK